MSNVQEAHVVSCTLCRGSGKELVRRIIGPNDRILTDCSRCKGTGRSPDVLRGA